MSIIEIPAVRVNAQELIFDTSGIDSIPEKFCSVCGLQKPVTEFHRHKHTISGYQSICKKCKLGRRKSGYYDKHKSIRHSRKGEFDKMVMKWGGGSCLVCGESRPIATIYDWHHIDPSTKEYDLSRLRVRVIGSVSQETFEKNVKLYLAEARKCVFVCANCHRLIHHYIDLQKDVPDEFKRFLPEAA